METIIEEIFHRVSTIDACRINRINHEIEMYWKEMLESSDDFFELDTTMDNDELADYIWDILFEHNEEYKFDYDYYKEQRMNDTSIEPDIHDIPIMINYFNTYFEETYGREELKFKDLDMNKIFMFYAHAYAGYNNLNEKIKDWLEENLSNDTDTETTEIPIWDKGKEEGEIIEE